MTRKMEQDYWKWLCPGAARAKNVDIRDRKRHREQIR